MRSIPYRIKPKKNMGKSQCPICNTMFQKTHPLHRYCSHPCKVKQQTKIARDKSLGP